MDWSAAMVGTSYDEGIFTVGFAADDGARGILFSRSDSIDEQDALLGMDTYCVSTETGAVFYGGIELARLSRRALEHRLSAEAAKALELPGELVLRFPDDPTADAAAHALRRVGIGATSA